MEKTSCLPDPLVPLDTKDRVRQSGGQRVSKSGGRISNGVIKSRCKSAKNSVHSVPSSTSQHQNGPSCNSESGAAKLIESTPAADGGGSRDTRATSVDRFSDVSRHSNSSRGYLVCCSSVIHFHLFHTFHIHLIYWMIFTYFQCFVFFYLFKFFFFFVFLFLFFCLNDQMLL